MSENEELLKELKEIKDLLEKQGGICIPPPKPTCPYPYPDYPPYPYDRWYPWYPHEPYYPSYPVTTYQWTCE